MKEKLINKIKECTKENTILARTVLAKTVLAKTYVFYFILARTVLAKTVLAKTYVFYFAKKTPKDIVNVFKSKL